MLGIENQQNNFGYSAGTLAKPFAQRPTRAALGTLFISTDTLLLYRWTGTAWVEISGSGNAVTGAFNGLQEQSNNVGLGGTLDEATEIFITDFTIDFNSETVPSPQFKVINSCAVSEFAAFTSILGFNDGGVYIGNYETRGTIQAKEYATQVVSELRLNYDGGDVTIGNVGGSQIIFYQSASVLSTNLNGVTKGIFLDGISNIYSFGDFDYNNNGTALNINDNNSYISSKYNGQDIGLFLDFNGNFYFGDFNGVNNQTYLQIDDINQQFNLNSAAFLSGSATGFSGNYLVIWINGTQYKIKLDNP